MLYEHSNVVHALCIGWQAEKNIFSGHMSNALNLSHTHTTTMVTNQRRNMQLTALCQDKKTLCFDIKLINERKMHFEKPKMNGK